MVVGFHFHFCSPPCLPYLSPSVIVLIIMQILKELYFQEEQKKNKGGATADALKAASLVAGAKVKRWWCQIID